MKLFSRTLLAVLAALWIALPSVGGEGGENGGGTGVWILPRCSALGSVPQACPGTGQMRQFSRLSGDITMVVSPQCGQVVATICDPGTGVFVPLSVSGRDVTLPESVLQAFQGASVTSVKIVIADAAQNGYILTLAVNVAAQSGSLQVH